ncbi:MAG TPA: phage minor head protein [Pseudolabrys sp.]|jgi:hypothetical protein|nr:phage minor head protein [Pseudolabrys sp.]
MKAMHSAFLALLDRLEPKLASPIAKEKNRFIKAAAARYLEHGTINFFDLVDTHQANVFDILKPHWNMAIAGGGQLALGHIKSRQMKDDSEDSVFEDLTQQWIATEGLKRSHSIAETSEADVLDAISIGIDDGLGTAEIGRAISAVTDLTPWRADTIARTETHNAASYGLRESARDAQEKLGIDLEKAWAATLDDRTRPAHAEMDDEDYIGMDEKFIVGGEEMDGPGDPAGSAENVCNCRCTLLIREAEPDV